MFTDTRLNLLARRFLHNGLQLCRSEKPLFSRFRSQACALPSDHARRHAQRHTPTPSTEAASLRSRNQNCPHRSQWPTFSCSRRRACRTTALSGSPSSPPEFVPREPQEGHHPQLPRPQWFWSAVAKRIFQFRGEAQVSLAKEPNVLKPVASTVILL